MRSSAIEDVIRRHADARPRPAFSAARVLLLEDGEPVADVVHGVEAASADARGTPLATTVPIDEGTRFDLASVTKLLTAATVLEVLADHGLDLDTPVAEALPEYRDDRRGIRFRHLLTHTAGLPPEWSGWRDRPDPDQARERVLAIRPVAAPGEAHVYSCIGYIHAGLAVEAIAGRPLDALVAAELTGPLGMTATGYRPDPSASIAATEWQDLPSPGITRGAVHDETARALGGVSGNAGIFATAADLAAFGEELRTGAGGVLRETTRDLMRRPVAPAGLAPDYEQAVGSRIGDRGAFGVLARGAFGHTGFTGTMLLVHPKRRLTLAVLTNAVHPDRSGVDKQALRRDLAAAIDGGAA